MKKIIISIVYLCLVMFLITGCSFNLPSFDKSSDQNSPSIQVDLSNTEYLTTNDKSYLVLGEAGKEESFKWYRTKDDLTDNYYVGKYYLYTGVDAFKFITSEISGYGVTEEELVRLLGGDYDSLVVLFVDYSDIIVDGKSQIDTFTNSIDIDHPKSISYYGEIDENGNLDLVNMMTANPVVFEKINDTNTDKTTEQNTQSSNIQLNKIHFDIPKNYELIDSTDLYLLYTDQEKEKSITVFFYEGGDLAYTKNYYKDGEELTVNGQEVYKYVDGEKYCCSILGNGGEYIIETDEESILDNILKTVEL